MQGTDRDQRYEQTVKDLKKQMMDLLNSPNWVANGNNQCEMFKIDIGERVASKGVAIVNYNINKVV